MRQLHRIAFMILLLGASACLLASELGKTFPGEASSADGITRAGGLRQPPMKHGPVLVIAPASKNQDFVDVLKDCVADEQWGDASTVVNLLLRENADSVIEVKAFDPAQKKWFFVSWSRMKTEVAKVLNSMPAKGLKVYKDKFGKPAQEVLRQTQGTVSLSGLQKVTEVFPLTPAAKEATARLAAVLLASRSPLAASAAVCQLDLSPPPLKIQGKIIAVIADGTKLKTLQKELAYVAITPDTSVRKQVKENEQAAQWKELVTGKTIECTLKEPAASARLFPAEATQVILIKD